MKKIAVLLTVFNRRNDTLRCLANLRKLQPSPSCSMDVYLTNDGCTDGTPEAVKKLYPEVHIIDGNGTLFWNRGMYAAWDCASKTMKYDYFLWLNDDTFLYDGAIESLLNAAQNKKDKAIIVGATVDTITGKTMTYGGRMKNGHLTPIDGKLSEVDYFNGNIVLIPYYVFNILGNLDYYFTHSKGDFDYGLRAGRKGIKMYQVGKALGTCDEHPALDAWCNPDVPFKKRWKMLHRPNGMPPKETFYFERRHYGIIMALFHFLTVYIRCFIPRLWVKLSK